METNKTLCKICKQIKERIAAGNFKNGRNKKWRDESGQLWNGKICGPCNALRLKEVMQNKRKVSDGKES